VQPVSTGWGLEKYLKVRPTYTVRERDNAPALVPLKR